MSPADRAIAARDPWVPALALVLGEGLTDAVRAAWCADGPAPDAVTLRYLRYKPAGQVAAAVQLRHGDRIRAALLVATSRSAEAKRSKLVVAARERDQPVLAQDDALGLLVVPVEADRHLAGSHQLLAIVRERCPELGDATAHVLAYKPHRRLVVRLDVAGQPRAVAKAHHADGYAATAAALRWGDARGSERLPLPHLLATDDRHHVAVTAWTPGYALDQQSPDRQRATLRGVGKILGRLHRRDPSGLPNVEAEERADHPSLRGLAMMRPDLVGDARRILELSPPPVGPTTPVHGDLSADQVVHGDDDGVALIDLDRTGRGHPASDLASWVAAAAVADPSAPATLPAPLWEGYRSVEGPACADDVARQVPRQLLSRLHEPFRERRPGWSEQLDRLVTRCMETTTRASAS